MNDIKNKIYNQIVTPLGIQSNYSVSNEVDTVVTTKLCVQLWEQVHVKVVHNSYQQLFLQKKII